MRIEGCWWIDKLPAMLSEWTDPERVADYLKREIPHREIAEGMLLEALPDRVERVLDLGTGDGRMLTLVLSEHPDAHGLGIDSSEPMLARARERFRSSPGVELKVHDLERCLDATGPFDVVVSGLAIHHLDDNRKAAIFAEIYTMLAPAGVFVNLDLVSSDTDGLHERFLRAIGRTHEDPTDQPATLCSQLEWLRNTGFAEVDCHFKWLELALIVAVRAS
jgi:tRNA (cmo5U34)-methyltransferase